MKYALLKSAETGSALLPVVKHIDQDKISTFGVITGSTGAVHVDPVYCAAAPVKTTLAHGFLTMAYVSEMMETNFGVDWAHSGEIEVKFIGAARPGDSVVARGTITETADSPEGEKISCAVEVVNQRDEKVLVGTASLLLKP